MLPGGWGGICHLTRPTAGRVGAREWLSGDGEGQMMLAERVGFLVLWRVLLPRGAAANSVTGSGGFGFPPVRRVGAFAPQVWHTCVGPEGHGERLLGIIPTGVSCVQAYRTSCVAERRSATRMERYFMAGPSVGLSQDTTLWEGK